MVVNMLDIDGHARRSRHSRRVCWPGSVSVENLMEGVSILQFSIGFAIGPFTMGMIGIDRHW